MITDKTTKTISRRPPIAFLVTLSLLVAGALVMWLPRRAEGANRPVPALDRSARTLSASGPVTSTVYLPVISESVPEPTPSPITNLLSNGTFESGNLGGWSGQSGGAAITSANPHGGTYAAQLTNGSIRITFATTPGKSYKVTGWVHIVSESSCPGCWGGMRFSAYDANWQEIGGSGVLLTATQGSGWFKTAFSFVATQTGTPMDVGYFGDSGRTMTVVVDDLMSFEKPAVDALPTISQISLSPATVTDASPNQSFSVTADDADGAIARVKWDFGDGTCALTSSGTRRAGVAGSYNATVTVTDDDGGMVQSTIPWTSGCGNFPSLAITSPSFSNLTVNTPGITLGGTSTSATSVQVSSDRGGLQTATGTAAWNTAMPLQPGFNRLLVQAQASNGRVATAELLVRYVPSDPLAISGLTAPATVERWEPLQVSFTVNNSGATNPQFPYQAAEPPGLQWVDGITVDGLFTPDNWTTVYRRPAFLYQPYQRALKQNEEWLYPQGQAVWAVRFAPPTLGNWKYRLQITEARGNAQSADGSFVVTAPTNPLNHGPVQVASADPRYFAFVDGTPFLGSGYDIGVSGTTFSYDADQKFTAAGANNENFFRWWLGGDLWGSAWQPWNSLTLGNDGYLPATGLTLDRAYGNGLASLRLDSANPVMIYGWNEGQVGLIPGHTYRFRVRWRTEGVTGPTTAGKPYGATIKITNWLNNPNTDTLAYPAIVPYVTGDTPWHVSEGTFVASSDYPSATGGVGFIAVARENATGGAVYVDEIGLYEDLGNGAVGPQLLRDPNFNTHLTFDPERAAGLDAVLADANAQGKYLKLVISEKDEFLINHFAPDGLPDVNGAFFDAGPGTPTNWLHQAYWRYLFARYGAYRSVQSWELVNETAPGPGPQFQLAAQLATLAAADGNPHLASTSTWATLAESAWKAPYSAPISYVDFHAYVRSTGWLEPKETLANDSAAFFNAYDLAARAANFGKPVVWGEQGIDGTSGSNIQDPDIPRDTAGTWLHKMIWARCGPGGVYPLYWYSDIISTNNLHSLYGAWNTFMTGIPFTNGHYQDIAATASNGLRVMGQRDLSAHQAYLWVDNPQDTWRAVVNKTSIPAVSGTVTFNLQLPNGSYTATWYNTQSGAATGTQTVTADGNGAVTLAVSNMQADQAVKLTPH